MSLGIGLLQGPTGGGVLMREVPLSWHRKVALSGGGVSSSPRKGTPRPWNLKPKPQTPNPRS